jgi:putative restriction endonuclease
MLIASQLFDRGIFSFNTNLQVLVSEDAHGNQTFEDSLMRYHGKKIAKPIHPKRRFFRMACKRSF